MGDHVLYLAPESGRGPPVKKSSNGTLPPIVLPSLPCKKCGLEHPERLMLNSQEAAGYLRHTVSSLYSKKSKRELPPCVPGRKTPFWIPCDLARYLFPRPVLFLRARISAKKAELAEAATDEEKAKLEMQIERLEFELRRSMCVSSK
jgi:hypothetical protein